MFTRSYCGFVKIEATILIIEKVIVREDWSYEAIVFDAGNGEIKEFRNELDKRGELFICQIPESHHFWSADIKIKRLKAKQVALGFMKKLKIKTKKPCLLKVGAIIYYQKGFNRKK